jgi:hypothetical protein
LPWSRLPFLKAPGGLASHAVFFAFRRDVPEVAKYAAQFDHVLHLAYDAHTQRGGSFSESGH